MPDLDKSKNQSTQMAFLIIEKMIEIGEPVGLSDLARQMGIARIRAYRFVRTLVDLGYVTQDTDGQRYRLTLKLFHLGQAIADRTSLLSESRPLMTVLGRETQCTATLSVPESDGMRVIDIVRAAADVDIILRPGSLLAFHSSAQGKVALAFGEPNWLATALEGPLTAATPQTITDPARLSAAIDEVRAKGWATSMAETLPGLNSVSAPIFDGTGGMVATVTLTGLAGAVNDATLETLAERVLVATHGISRNLGAPPHVG